MPLAAHHPMLAGPKCHHCLCLHHSSLLAPWLVIGFVRLATKVGEMAGISGHQLCLSYGTIDIDMLGWWVVVVCKMVVVTVVVQWCYGCCERTYQCWY